MKILLTNRIVELLKRELQKAGKREIGGLLMGEHLGEGVFRVVDISVQRSGGDQVCFRRQPGDHQAQLDDFFKRHDHDYLRFNYLGEWHSHPSFPAVPSTHDMATMTSIVADPEVGANFLVLLIVRLDRDRIAVSATAFRPDDPPQAVDLEAEQSGAIIKSRGGIFSRLWRLFN